MNLPNTVDNLFATQVTLQRHLSAVYSLTPSAKHLFASPLGPFHVDGQQSYLPRFVFFGPYASDISWRIAFIAGFDQRDLRSSHALLALAEQLVEEADDGNGLDVTFFPLVDVAGTFLGTPDRALGRSSWRDTAEPELILLKKDAELRRYHGFVRVETAEPGEEAVSVRICGGVADLFAPDLALITTDDAARFPVRFEKGWESEECDSGPLSLSIDQPFTPLQLTLRIPADWPDEKYQTAVVTLLRRFLWRYRAFQAYGQNL